MRQTISIITEAMRRHNGNATLAFSGGSDSNVLLDLIFTRTPHRPKVVFIDSGLEYAETLPYIKERCATYGAELHISKPQITLQEQIAKNGWPFGGKQAARLWNRSHKEFDYRLSATECCRNLKIAPGRRLTKRLGCNLQFVGTRGQADDMLRGLRTLKDTAYHYNKSDRLYICAPLTGWPDGMIMRYLKQNSIPPHPLKARGLLTTGCRYCGCGSQFSNSGLRVLRTTDPAAWFWWIVEQEAGLIVLALKYNVTLAQVRAAVAQLGGLAHLAETRPYLFDYTRKTPMRGYTR